MNKDLNYYMALPWVFEFEKSPSGGYYARVKNISCYSYGDNMLKATENIREALECYIESCLLDNEFIPEATNINDLKLENNEMSVLIEVVMPTLNKTEL